MKTNDLEFHLEIAEFVLKHITQCSNCGACKELAGNYFNLIKKYFDQD